MAVGSPFELALAAASARNSDQRARKLVQLAAALRRERRLDEALGILDLVVELAPPLICELAAYTCAVAIHCDRGDFETARVVGEETRAKAVDVHLLRALGRMYAGLFRETGEVALKDEADECFKLAGLAEHLEPDPAQSRH